MESETANISLATLDALRADRATLISDRKHLEAELTLRHAEIERLVLERDYWERARNEWEKACRVLQEENKKLTRERDEARKILEKARRGIAVLGDTTKHLGLQQGQDVAARLLAEIDALPPPPETVGQ